MSELKDGINWKQKLSSRKFWAAAAAVLLAAMTIFGMDEVTKEQFHALLMAVGALTAYILGEGFVDAVRVKYDCHLQQGELEEEEFDEFGKAKGN